MKKIILLNIFLLITGVSFGQMLYPVGITDWNKIQKAGFFVSQATENSNNPIINNGWWWGINIPSGGNENNKTYHNAQIAIMSSSQPAQMYVRSTGLEGNGVWAKVVHSKGNHAIDGKLTVKEVEIKINTGADIVFSPNYKLRSLLEVETFVKENKHLPDIPSEKQMQENGLNLNDMQIKLLQKIEELTLYVIDLKKENQEIKQELELLKNKK